MALDNQSSELFGQTPSQTVGPFFHYGLPWNGGANLVGDTALGARPDLVPDAHFLLNAPTPKGATIPGEVIEVIGMVLDADGAPVPDAMVEIWQADASGRYGAGDEPGGFIGFGRSSTSEGGEYRFRTVRPGRVPGPSGVLQAAHVAVSVLGRGILKRLATRLYFEDGGGLDEDPVLLCVPEGRRRTLLARRIEAPLVAYRFDIVLQGPAETVFFDI
jgi:protocatechuate 3,4-dioxygenase alpha subunit